jgi:hypothetical protein
LLECTKFNEEETAPFIDEDLCKLMIHPVVYYCCWKEILCVKKSCNCTKILPPRCPLCCKRWFDWLAMF